MLLCLLILLIAWVVNGHEGKWPYIPKSSLPSSTLETLCHKMNKEIVLVVYTSLYDPFARKLARAQLGQYRDLQENVALLFSLGAQDEHHRAQAEVDQEIATYGDIFQGNFTELYEHLGLKLTATLSFLRKTCAHENSKHRYYLKVDSDQAWNLGAFYEWTRKHELGSSGIIAGRLGTGIKVLHGVSKNSEPELAHMSIYPPYVFGGCAVFDTRAADVMLENRPHFPYFTRNDDILFGFLTEHSTVQLHGDRRFLSHEGMLCQAREHGPTPTVPQTPALKECDCGNWFCMNVGGKLRQFFTATEFAVLCHRNNFTAGQVEPDFAS